MLEETEIFETSSVEDNYELFPDDHTRRDSIDEEQMDLDLVRERFADGLHTCEGSCTLDTFKKGYKETTKMRLERLKLEMDELLIDLEGERDELEKCEKKELLALWEKLRDNVKQRGKVVLGGLPQEAGHTDIEGSVADPTAIQTLEQRIHRLEQVIGVQQLTPDSSLQSQINQLQRHIQLLTDETTQQQITRTIEQVNLRFEQSIALRRSVEMEVEIQEDAKIHELYQFLESTKGIQDELPWLIKRLESLNVLHMKTAGSVAIVDEMDARMGAMGADMEQWEKTLEAIEGKLNRDMPA